MLRPPPSWPIAGRRRLAAGVLILATVLPTALAAQAFETDRVRGQVLLRFGPSYNRVNGLPIQIGPVLETIEDEPWRFSGMVTVRLEDDLPTELDQVGFDIQAEKAFGGKRFAVGARGWSRVAPIETRGLTDLESSLSALAFRDDRRDYYDALGVLGYVRYGPEDSPLSAYVGYGFEDQDPINVGGVTSIFRGDTPWRDQPLAASGTFGAIQAGVGYDTRPDRRDGPFNGWWAEAGVTAGVAGTLRYLPAVDLTSRVVTSVPDPTTNLVVGRADLRRYNAFGDLGINLRVVAEGSLTDDPLPTQFQYAPGGAGTLPGLPLFGLDCGAHATGRVRPLQPTLATTFVPFYGCDRYMMAQIEIEGYFGFAIGRTGPRNAWQGPGGLDVRVVPQWVLFANAGHGWTNLGGIQPTAVDTDWAYDVGGGIVFGNIGAYAAYPLNVDDPVVRIVFRLERRF